MRKEIIPLEVIFFDSASEMNSDDNQLLSKAADAAKRAYAPYSEFQVGSAVRLANGKIIQGNNQENAAYPSGLCAERVALFYAAAEYPDVAVEALAITVYTHTSKVKNPVPPCGACRQVMAESENRFKHNMRVIMQGESGPVLVVENMKTLLPFTFLDEYLPKGKKQ